MWIFSETGFVSAVQHRDDPNKFIVRGRDRKSLEPLAKMARTKIIENEGTDYPFRVFVTRKRFGQWVAKQIENLDYTNYKGRMYSTRPEFGNALHDVWSDMHAVSPGRQHWGRGRHEAYVEDVWGPYDDEPDYARDVNGIPLGLKR